MARETYSERTERLRSEGRREGQLQEREAALAARQQRIAASRQPRPGARLPARTRAARGAAQAAGKARRTPYLALTLATATISMVQLTRTDKLTSQQKRGALFGVVILTLTIAFVGELSPELATGFAGLVLIAVVIGGTDSVNYIFEEIPHRLIGGTAQASSSAPAGAVVQAPGTTGPVGGNLPPGLTGKAG